MDKTAKKTRLLRRRLLTRAGMPPEVAQDQPRVTWVGRESLLVEGHVGIVLLSTQVLRVRTRCGDLQVTGEDMELEELGEGKLLLSGRVDGVAYPQEGAGEGPVL